MKSDLIKKLLENFNPENSCENKIKGISKGEITENNYLKEYYERQKQAHIQYTPYPLYFG